MFAKVQIGITQKMVAVMGANLNMTRTPDCHFFAESRHNGTKAVVFAPDFNQVAKYADQWVPLHAGSDGAFWMAVTHVILKEFHHDKQTPYFIEYTKRYTDSPYLVELKNEGDYYSSGRLLRANQLEAHKDIDQGDWKFVNIDEDSGDFVIPKGSSGYRWQEEKGKWNMKYEDGETDREYNPVLSLLDSKDDVVQVEFTEFGLDKKALRGVPVKRIHTVDGERLVTTVYDLTMAQYGVSRGLNGDYPKGYDEKRPGIHTGLAGNIYWH